MRSFAFDVGHLSTATNAAATIEYDYDQRGRLIMRIWDVDSAVYRR